MKARTIVIAAGVVLAGTALIAWQKIKTLKEIFDRMSIRPSGISNFQVGLMQLRFNLDFKITNPTNEAFAITGASIARLKRIVVYYNGRYMGIAELNLTEIEIPANSYTVLEKVPFTVSTQNLLYNLLTVDDINLSNLTLHAIIDVLGNEYLIEG